MAGAAIKSGLGVSAADALHLLDPTPQWLPSSLQMLKHLSAGRSTRPYVTYEGLTGGLHFDSKKTPLRAFLGVLAVS